MVDSCVLYLFAVGFHCRKATRREGTVPRRLYGVNENTQRCIWIINTSERYGQKGRLGAVLWLLFYPEGAGVWVAPEGGER